MIFKRIISTGVLLLVPVLALGEEGGQESSLRGPISGIVFDKANRSVRPVIGVPGSGYLGEAVVGNVDAAVSSPDGKSTLYVKEGRLLLLRATDSPAELLSGLEGSVRIVWSADSSAAAIYSADSGALKIWKRADSLVVNMHALPGSAIDLAVADAGAHVIAAIEKTGASGVYLAAKDEVRLLAGADRPGAVALNAGDLFFADGARGQVWALRHYLNGGDLAVVAHAGDVAGLAAVASKGLLLVASSSQARASAFRIDSGEMVYDLPLDFKPSGLQRLSESSWLLNAGESGPLQVLVDGASPAVYFVPAQ